MKHSPVVLSREPCPCPGQQWPLTSSWPTHFLWTRNWTLERNGVERETERITLLTDLENPGLFYKQQYHKFTHPMIILLNTPLPYAPVKHPYFVTLLREVLRKLCKNVNRWFTFQKPHLKVIPFNIFFKINSNDCLFIFFYLIYLK